MSSIGDLVSLPPLRGLGWDHPRGLDALRGSNDLLLQNTGLSVDWTPRSLKEFSEDTPAEAFDEYDLISIDHPHVPEAVDKGFLVALDAQQADAVARLATQSVGASHASYHYREHQWGLATDAAAQVSAFRPDRVDRAPIYWDEVFTDSSKGTLLWPYTPVDAISTFMTVCAQLGSPMDGRPVGSGVMEQALDHLRRLASLVPQWCATANPIGIAEALSGDDDFTTAVALFGYSNYSRTGFRAHPLVYHDVQSFDGRASGAVLGGAGLAVSARSSRIDEATTAAIFLSSEASQSTDYVFGGGQPGNIFAWKSERVNVDTRHFFTNTLRTLERAWVRPSRPDWPLTQLTASHIVHDALTGERTSASTIQLLHETFNREEDAS